MKALIALSLVGAVTLAACNPMSGSAPEPSPTPAVDATTQGSSSTEPMLAEEGAVTVIPVTANDFTYDVKEIKVKQGDKLVISLTNSEGFHDLLIDELGVNSGPVGVGQTVELVIPTDKPGTYEYYCSVGDHRAMGMWGTLTIE